MPKKNIMTESRLDVCDLATALLYFQKENINIRNRAQLVRTIVHVFANNVDGVRIDDPEHAKHIITKHLGTYKTDQKVARNLEMSIRGEDSPVSSDEINEAMERMNEN